MSVIVEVGSTTLGQPTQPCPACDGTMPADAVVCEPWGWVEEEGVVYRTRLVYMRCPHCDHSESREERRPTVV